MTAQDLAAAIALAFPQLKVVAETWACVKVSITGQSWTWFTFGGNLDETWFAHVIYCDEVDVADLAAAIALVNAERLALINSLLLDGETLMVAVPRPAVNCTHCDDKGGTTAAPTGGYLGASAGNATALPSSGATLAV